MSHRIVIMGIDCDLVLIAPPMDLKMLTAIDNTHQRISDRLPQVGDDIVKAQSWQPVEYDAWLIASAGYRAGAGSQSIYS